MTKGFTLYNDGKYHSPPNGPPQGPIDRDTEKGEHLKEGDHETFRRAVGQPLWLAGDRPHLRYALTLSSAVHQPTTKDKSMLKKVVRYLGWGVDQGPASRPLNNLCKRRQRSQWLRTLIVIGEFVKSHGVHA
eukprot:2876412-Amphidinium_carterae.1